MAISCHRQNQSNFHPQESESSERSRTCHCLVRQKQQRQIQSDFHLINGRVWGFPWLVIVWYSKRCSVEFNQMSTIKNPSEDAHEWVLLVEYSWYHTAKLEAISRSVTNSGDFPLTLAMMRSLARSFSCVFSPMTMPFIDRMPINWLR